MKILFSNSQPKQNKKFAFTH